MLARLAKFSSLRAADKALLLRVLMLVLGIRLALWILPFHAVHRWANAATSRAQSRPPICPRPISVLASIVQVVARRIPDATCLTQALAAQILLAQSGHRATLRIGVHRAAGQFKAHAWIESEGKIVIGDVPGMNEFAVLPDLSKGG